MLTKKEPETEICPTILLSTEHIINDIHAPPILAFIQLHYSPDVLQVESLHI